MTLEEANAIINKHFRRVKKAIKETGSTPFLDAIKVLQEHANRKFN